ncbi:hypothetical protein [Enterococcus cecorum]|uniref:hypothetical protein n=2 Tax=Enterococcus cecorum TaxID=44008 RepID=UPI00148BD269
MTTILTNKLKIKYDLEKIQRDYDFIKIIREDKTIYGAHILDLDFVKVDAIVFENGHSLVLMYRKNKHSSYIFNEYFRNSLYMDSYRAMDVSCKDLVENNVLLQLFLNALSNYSSDDLKYNNLTGNLFITHPALIVKKVKDQPMQLDALQVKVDKEETLNFSANRFNSVKYRNKMKIDDKKFRSLPKYELLSNGTLKRHHKGEAKQLFVQRAVDNEKASIPFLDISSFEKFNASKMGMMSDLLERFEIYFGEYVHLEFVEYTDVRQALIQSERFELGNHDLGTELYLIDKICDEHSKVELKRIQHILLDKYGLKSRIVKYPQKDAMNIVYVHEKEYYEKQQLVDPYINDKAFLTHHLTVEGFLENEELTIEVILKELLIKKDLEKQQISLLDWSDFQFEHEWIFINKISGEENRYLGMKIYPTGHFVFTEFENTLFSNHEYNQYADILASSKAEGLIIDHHKNINVIVQTKLYSLQEMHQIRRIFKQTKENQKYFKDELADLLDHISTQTKSQSIISEVSDIKEYLDSVNEPEISQQYFVQKLHHKTLKQKMNDYFVMNYQKHLFPYFRNQQNKSEIYRGSLDIHYWQIDEKRAQYCVGEKSKNPKQKMDKGVIIREVQAIDDAPVFFDELLPLMDVDFVRLGSLTVLPFPFKYLSEYAKKYI